ncbi:MAG: hypothetical protein HY294_15170 [Candidatus Rokubacteria bacterium]|nr:hypothetical protein [Candidatus Rokubacteria bacterium]
MRIVTASALAAGTLFVALEVLSSVSEPPPIVPAATEPPPASITALTSRDNPLIACILSPPASTGERASEASGLPCTPWGDGAEMNVVEMTAC